MANGTLKVSNIQTSSGSGTITLGQSGETVNVSGTAGTGFGKILQIVQASTTSTTSITSTSYADVGLTASITPISTSNKVLVNVFCSVGVPESGSSGDDCFLRLVRGSTAIGGGNSVASDAFFHATSDGGAYSPRMSSFTFLDSPSASSSTAYKVQMKNRNGSKQSYFNRRGGDTMSLISYITLMEVAG